MPKLDSSCYKTKPPVTGMGYITLRYWGKEVHGISQTIQAIAKATSCSPQTDGKALLQKTTVPYVTKHGEMNLLPSEASSLWTIIHCGWKGPCILSEERLDHQFHLATSLVPCNRGLPARYTRTTVAQISWQ